jgi:DNA-binding NtrC family response regulator
MAHIMIIEECTERLRLLQTALRGHKLVCSANVERALATIRTSQFDLLIAPVYLDDGDIFYVVRSAAELDRNLRIVLYTTDKTKTAKYATQAIQSASGHLGVHKYILLENPDMAELRQQLEQCMTPGTCATLSSDSGRIYEL